MPKKVVVDQENCIGCGVCVAIASKTFKLNDEGKVELIQPAGDKEEIIKEAIDSCPVTVISQEESK